MPLLQVGENLYTDLRASLVEFRKSSASERESLLKRAIASVDALGEHIQTKEDAMEAYRRMAFTATLINYSDALYRIDHQQFFDILIDFKMPELFAAPRFSELANYFKFHDHAPQMKLLVSREDIPSDIWKLFREAQKEKLRIKSTSHKFNLDELDIDHLPEDQLYPLPIQMFGAYLNQAVDRIWGSKHGQYAFANPFGVFLLPGGGMIEIDLDKTKEKILQKMLDEHFEEQHGNLWYKAVSHYNHLSSQEILSALSRCFNSNKNLEKYKLEFEEVLAISDEPKKNSDRIALAVGIIQSLIEQRPEDKKLLLELRASVQVETLKTSSFYQEALAFLRDHSLHVLIEQLGDTRACGGRQLSNVYLMFGDDLLELIKAQCAGEDAEAADDITGSKFVHMSLLKAIELHPKIKFSHLLIVLAHQIEALNRGVMSFENVWKNEEFLAARYALKINIQTQMSMVNPKNDASNEPQSDEASAVRAALVAGPGLFADAAAHPQVAEDAESSIVRPR